MTSNVKNAIIITLDYYSSSTLSLSYQSLHNNIISKFATTQRVGLTPPPHALLYSVIWKQSDKLKLIRSRAPRLVANTKYIIRSFCNKILVLARNHFKRQNGQPIAPEEFINYIATHMHTLSSMINLPSEVYNSIMKLKLNVRSIMATCIVCHKISIIKPRSNTIEL